MEIGALPSVELDRPGAASRMTSADAAQEFEAIVIAELLKAAREAGEAWGSEEKETGSESYLEYAEQHLSRILASQDLLGFKRIALEDLGESEPGTGQAANDLDEASR